MRPVRLELRGFTAFRNETVVDFDGRRLFVITGPTGAGKSSLLDAITWALYGRVPRVGNQTKQLLSHGAQAMAVRFDFRAHGETYRVSRQAGKSSAMRLDREVAPGQWQSLADKAGDVAAEVERIIGLDYDTFTKTVLLPQGAFDAFLRGEPGQRRDILSGLLGLGVYEQMRETAQARASGAHSLAGLQRQQAERLADATPEAIAALEAERAAVTERIAKVGQQRERLAMLVALERDASERARDAVAAASAARAASEAHALALQAVAEAQQACDEATQQLSTLAAEREALAYDADRHRVLEHQAAQLRQREQARAELVRAEAVEAAARQACEAARAVAERTLGNAERQRAEASTVAGVLVQARLELAVAAGTAKAVSATLRDAQALAETERAEAEQRAASGEGRMRLLDALTGQVVQVAADLEAADAEVQRARSAAALAEAERVRAAAAESAAQAAASEAAAEREHAEREHAAAGLRRGLAIGDLCPVCGEPITALTEHETPDLDAAHAAVETAERALSEAREEHARRMREASAAHARVEAVEEALATVHARLVAVEASCAEADVAPSAIAAARAQAEAAVLEARAQGADASQRAAAAVERERAVAMLLAALPADVAHAEAALVDGVDVEQALRDTLARHVAASTSARATADATRAAEEAAHRADAEASHAAERAAAATTALADAIARLEALGAVDEDAGALLAALEEAERAARRHADIEQRIRATEQARAGATSRLEERRISAEQAATAIAARDAEARTATEAAALASEAYAEQWRTIPNVTAAPDAESLANTGHRLEQASVAAATELGMTEQRITQASAQRAEAERLLAEAALHERAASVSGDLAVDLQKNRFIAFVQREAMQVLADEAADRMEHLSRGRYRMRAVDDEFVIVDRLNGDEQRSVRTLSGGETFLASLALALALAERLPELAGHGGALSLESLFLDEGFGSLDADALDVAIEALELLAGDDRMIGVISHVPLIAERLPDRIEVMRSGGGSTVRG